MADTSGYEKNIAVSESLVSRSLNFVLHSLINFFALSLVSGCLAVYFLPANHAYIKHISDSLGWLGGHLFASNMKGSHILTNLAGQFESNGMSYVAEKLLLTSQWEHIDAVFLPGLSAFITLIFLILIRSMIIFRINRANDVESKKPIICSNGMTVEEFNNKRFTYVALAELMKCPEFEALKASRKGKGMSEWNWQKREPMTDDSSLGDMSEATVDSDEASEKE